MAAGAGWTAASDTNLTKITIGATVSSGPYASAPTNNWVGCFTAQFTSSTKATPAEWLTSSDTAYTRVPMGAAGAGWTVAAYANGVGVVFTNTNALTGATVAGANQTLFSIGIMDSVGPTGGNALFFADLNTSIAVNIGQAVVLPATSPGPAGLLFTLY